ncbi:hypothetical protein B0H21DRAFT_13295 [Amylocystis lapponica]|nr:hypothetical protein B0H21DRAFT_13295 [Amylocystis lapponica]
MSVLAQMLRPSPASARRAYSVFSKAGGGRYFNSAKPHKVGPPTNKSKVDSSNASGDGSSSGAVKDQSSPQSAAPMAADGSPLVETILPAQPSTITVHPAINPHDLKLHQFFSLHRPLLLMSQPASSIFDAGPTSFTWPPKSPSERANLGNSDEPPEASPEEDADAARQLARTMVVNRVGASLSWEDTLKRLGLDVTAGRAEEVSLAEAEFEIYMDSTKRKRRKKMKKHKLKKRRRLSRSQRVKTGR